MASNFKDGLCARLGQGEQATVTKADFKQLFVARSIVQSSRQVFQAVAPMTMSSALSDYLVDASSQFVHNDEFLFGIISQISECFQLRFDFAFASQRCIIIACKP